MQKTLALLVVVGLMGSVAAKADPFNAKTASVPIKKKAAATRPLRQHIYITSVATTGSHLPLVVTSYGGDVHSNSSFIAYSPPQLNQTGQLNVGAQLSRRDPAISSFGGIRR